MHYLQYIPPRQPPSHLNIITTFSFVSLFLLQLHSGRGGSRIMTTPSAARSTTATLTGARSCAAPSAPWRAMTSSPSRSGRGSSRRRRSRYGYSHGLPCKSKNLGPHSTFIKKATMQIAIAWEVHAPSKIAQFSLPHGAGNLKRSVFLFSSQYAFFQNYADKVRISSKLVARITRLPYMSDTRRVSYLVRFTNNILSDHLFTIWNF